MADGETLRRWKTSRGTANPTQCLAYEGYKVKCSASSPVATHTESYGDALDPPAEEICVYVPLSGIGEVLIFPRSQVPLTYLAEMEKLNPRQLDAEKEEELVKAGTSYNGSGGALRSSLLVARHSMTSPLPHNAPKQVGAAVVCTA